MQILPKLDSHESHHFNLVHPDLAKLGQVRLVAGEACYSSTLVLRCMEAIYLHAMRLRAPVGLVLCHGHVIVHAYDAFAQCYASCAVDLDAYSLHM